jgi:fatty-acyl-CoA synthase
VEGVHSWVRTWARVNGSGIALTCGGRSVSWRELDRRVDVYAQHLVSLGIAPGDRVGCLMPNSVDYLEVLYGVSRVGAVFVPINVRYTPAELGFAAGHADLALLAAGAGFRDTIDAAGLVCPVDYEGPAADGPRFDRESPTRWTDDGFLLFTSGSTGAPRAVQHSAGSFFWMSMDALLVHGFNRRDRMLSPLPLCFTGGLNVAMAVGHAGAELITMPSFDADAAFDLIETRRPTLFHGVPMMAQALADHPRWAGADLSSLRQARSGGAATPVALMQAWAERGLRLTAGYGQTESAGSGLTLPVDEAHRSGKSGLPSFHIDVRVVDPATGRDVRAGDVGELLLRGPQIMRGYWREPEATARVLRDGWLWTGDLAHVDDDGFYEIVGRSKELIITGGLNVYPPEVDQVLAEAPGIVEAAVVGVPSRQWGEEVVGVVVADPGVDLTAVLAHCRAVLADYKCPKRLLVRAEPLTRTTSGKVIRREVTQWALDELAVAAP